MTIMPNGNVGIGTTSPAQKLDVVGDIRSTFNSNNFSQLESNTSGGVIKAVANGVENVLIRSYGNAHFNGGNVGIGTTNPTTRLHIFGADPILVIQDSETSGTLSDSRLRLAESGVSNAINEYYDIRKDGRNFRIDQFNAVTTTTPFYITEGGSVGIGTTSPTLASGTGLVVYNASDTTRLELRNSVTGNLASDGMGLLGSGNNYVIFNRESGFLRFDVNGSERLKIESSGLVGINETSPTAQLQVKSGATSRVPLIVDTLASHTAVLQEWRNNGLVNTAVYQDGTIATRTRIENLSNTNNSRIALATNGVFIERNIADGNSPLTVVAQHASSGDITRFQSNISGTTATRSYIDKNGVFYKNETKLTLTEPTFTEVSTNVFEYTITETQINNNDVIEITKTATASGQIYRLIVPNNSKQVRIWYTIIGSGASTIAEVSLLKTLGERVEYIFDRQEANGASLLQADTSNYLNYNVSTNPVSFLYKNVNGTQKTLSVTFDNEI
jgi:hypothetical protein